MAGFNGRWKMIDHANLVEYHDQIKTPEEHKEKLRTIIKASMADPESYIEEFKVDVPGKTVYRTLYINGVKTREVKLPIGVETDLPGADGRPYKGKLTFDGETKIRFHQKAADYEADQVFELKGDTILLTLTSGSVSGTHTYQRA